VKTLDFCTRSNCLDPGLHQIRGFDEARQGPALDYSLPRSAAEYKRNRSTSPNEYFIQLSHVYIVLCGVDNGMVLLERYQKLLYCIRPLSQVGKLEARLSHKNCFDARSMQEEHCSFAMKVETRISFTTRGLRVIASYITIVNLACFIFISLVLPQRQN
jgi:hypothetical protein